MRKVRYTIIEMFKYNWLADYKKISEKFKTQDTLKNHYFEIEQIPAN